MPAGELHFHHDGGNEYTNTLFSNDFGGSHFRFRLEVAF